MLFSRQDFQTLRECYKWAWVLNHGTAFYETHCYQASRQFYYLRSRPDGAARLDHPPAIALPPRLFIDLVCGSAAQAPALEKIRQAAQTFEQCWRDLSDCPELSVADLALYYDCDSQKLGVTALDSAVLGDVS